MAAQKGIDLLEPNLRKSLGLTRVYEGCSLLDEWLEVNGEMTETENRLLQKVRNDLIINADAWNEEELKMTFISMIIFLSYFENPIKTYYEREISETIGGEYLKCVVDMMLSKGVGELFETPLFFPP